MLIGALHPPNSVQIRKLMVSFEDGDGDLWGDPDGNDEENDDPVPLRFP